MNNENVWQIRIGGNVVVPPGGDAPMRNAVERVFSEAFGEMSGCFSGWGNTWRDTELFMGPGLGLCEDAREDRVWQCRIGGRDVINVDESRLRGVAMCAYLTLFDAVPRFVYSKWDKWTDSEIEIMTPPGPFKLDEYARRKFEANGVKFTTRRYGKIAVPAMIGSDGGYIANYETDSSGILRMLVKYSIWNPLKAAPDHDSASIGKCQAGEDSPERDKVNYWFGWSHRAVMGFGVGDFARECYPNEDKVAAHPIETDEQAKQAAINFAESVS